MNIRILGTGSGMPSKALNCSSILVQSQNKTYLLDAGEGISKMFLQLDLAPDDLDAIMISHYHPDHIGGLFLLIQMLYLAKREQPLHLFLPEREQDFLAILTMFYTFPEKFGFQLQIHPLSQVSEFFPDVIAQINDHLHGYREIISKNALKNEMKAYSIRINSPKGAFVYSSDISTTDSIRELVDGAHTVVVDAGHPPADQIIQLDDFGIRRVLLTHEPSPELRQLLQENPRPSFEHAIEGGLYNI